MLEYHVKLRKSMAFVAKEMVGKMGLNHRSERTTEPANESCHVKLDINI